MHSFLNDIISSESKLNKNVTREAETIKELCRISKSKINQVITKRVLLILCGFLRSDIYRLKLRF